LSLASKTRLDLTIPFSGFRENCHGVVSRFSRLATPGAHETDTV
jgi:hypothetical protein